MDSLKKMRLLICMMLILILLPINSINGKNSKVGISGSDTIINNINRPFTLQEIEFLANIQVVDSNNEVIDVELRITENNWFNNETSLGTYKIKYLLEFNNEEYEYILTIYNVVINIPVSLLEVDINSNYDLLDIINLIERNERINITKYTVIKDTYSNNSKLEGEYTVSIKAITTQGVKSYEYLISVTSSNKDIDIDDKYLIISGVVVIVFIYIIYNKIKKKRGKV